MQHVGTAGTPSSYTHAAQGKIWPGGRFVRRTWVRHAWIKHSQTIASYREYEGMDEPDERLSDEERESHKREQEGFDKAVQRAREAARKALGAG
jgi:hypothetical protein